MNRCDGRERGNVNCIKAYARTNPGIASKEVQSGGSTIKVLAAARRCHPEAEPQPDRNASNDGPSSQPANRISLCNRELQASTHHKSICKNGNRSGRAGLQPRRKKRRSSNFLLRVLCASLRIRHAPRVRSPRLSFKSSPSPAPPQKSRQRVEAQVRFENIHRRRRESSPRRRRPTCSAEIPRPRRLRPCQRSYRFSRLPRPRLHFPPAPSSKWNKPTVLPL
jgi:hypothetical protein